MTILLIGFLGSGRSSVSKILAEKLSYDFIEMDDLILQKTDFNSINDAYNENISLWKEKELEVSKELCKKDNIVVACSGAVVENKLNITYFKESFNRCIIIYLKTSPKELTTRLINLYEEFDHQNPKKVLARMSSHFARREAHYEQNADITVDTDDRTPEETSEVILTKISG